MRHALSLLSLFLLSFIAQAAEPQPGLWWNPAESGRGYAIDVQADTMVVTTFAYDSSGRMQWYIASGHHSNNGTHFSAPLLKFDFGQPLNGVYTFPTAEGNDGFITIDFATRTTGTLTLPGGRQIAIQRQNFGVGDPPQALLGQWLFAYTIITTFGDRYAFTTVAAATSFGTGVVIDPLRNATEEYETSGSFAGRVVGFQFACSTCTAILNTYVWTLQLEEGRGSWVASTGNTYGMNVYKTETASGVPKEVDAATIADNALKSPGMPQPISIEQMAAVNPELAQIAREQLRAFRAVQR